MNIRPDSELAQPIRIQGLINRLEDWRGVLHQQLIKRRLRLAATDEPDQQLVKDVRLLHVAADLKDTAQVEALIKALKDWLARAPVVHLTFSTRISRQMEKEIIDWFHKNIDPGVLADFKVDGSIAAGFVLRTKNHVFNFTGNQILWQNRHKIGELTAHV